MAALRAALTEGASLLLLHQAAYVEWMQSTAHGQLCSARGVLAYFEDALSAPSSQISASNGEAGLPITC